MQNTPLTTPAVLIRSEYREMPGLSLNEQQVARFWHLDASAARDALARLVESGFLYRTARGSYMRADLREALRRRTESERPRP